jgi:hypothetical protein
MATMMTFWRGNRIDGRFEARISEVAAQFWASEQGQAFLGGGMSDQRPLDTVLRLFLTDPAGFNSVWTDEGTYDELFDQVRATWPKAGLGTMSQWTSRMLTSRST